jgi:hypothetical protein
MCAVFFFEEVTALWDGGGGRILLGDTAGVMLQSIRFLGAGDGISIWLASLHRHNSPYMNTPFRLALVLPERDYCLSRGVSVAYLFIQNLSPALCIWFVFVTWTSDCNLWGTCKLIEFYATLGQCASCTVSTPLTDSKTLPSLLTHVACSWSHIFLYYAV